MDKGVKSAVAAICTAAFVSTPSVLATPTTNEETTAEGCIAVDQGSADFSLAASFTLTGEAVSGTLLYADAGAGVNVSSSTLIDYSYMDPNVRGFAFSLSEGAYTEARVYVTDNGESGDMILVQLLDSSGLVVYEEGGVLAEECGGGVVITEPPPEEEPPAEEPPKPPKPPKEDRPHDQRKGNNGVGNGEDPQPPGNPPINDGPGTGPGNPGNRGGARK